MKELVFIEEISGISKKDRPYNLIKLANPKTYENYVISYDPNYVTGFDFQRGQKVSIDGELRVIYNNTNFVVTSIKKVI